MKQVSLLLSITLTFLFVGCKKQADPIPKPIAAFSISYQSNGRAYLFNESKNSTSYQWEFSDGRKTIEVSPTVDFPDNGDYNVRLTAKGEGGYDSAERTVQIRNLPTTGSNVFWTGFNGSFIDVSVNGNFIGTSTKYMTSGVAPNCGIDGFVTVTLPAGNYSFSAKTQSLVPLKWSGTFTIVNGQCRSMQLTK